MKIWRILPLFFGLALTGCSFSLGTASGQQAEANAVKEIPGNTVSHTPFAASGSQIKAFLPRTTQKLIGSGPVYLAYVTLKKLPKAPYVFLEDTHGRLISRLPYYPSFATMTQADIRGYTTDPTAIRILDALHSDTSYAKLIVDVVGVAVRNRAVSVLPKELRKSFSGVNSVQVVDFLTLSPASKAGARENPVYITTIVLKPGTSKVGANYSRELPIPKGLN